MPPLALLGLGGKDSFRCRMGARSISLLAGQRPTKATMDRGSERKAPHIGTETRPKLLREAAVRNIGQWTALRVVNSFCMGIKYATCGVLHVPCE